MSGARDAYHHDVVVVGGGPAAATMVMRLVTGGFARSVVLLTEEDLPPYDRTVVSKGMLADPSATPPPLFADAVGPVTRTGTRVDRIDPDRHVVELANGSPVGFGTLVLATGAEPWVPPIEGAALPGVSVLRRAADAVALRRRFGEGSTDLAIVGGGVIGLEVAAVATERGCRVTVLEATPRPMARVLPPAVVAPLLEEHRAAGVDVRLAVQPKTIEAHHGRLRVTGRDHAGAETTLVACEHVLIATGARPRSALAEAAGLAVNDGVLVDDQLRTSHPDILAIGDVARVRAADGSSVRTESYTDAMAMGQHAAAALAGNASPYEQVPWSWSDQYDLTVQATGWPDHVDTWVDRGDPARLEDALVSIGLADGRIVAAAGISRGRAVGRIIKGAQAAIGARASLTAEQAADPTVDLRRLARS